MVTVALTEIHVKHSTAPVRLSVNGAYQASISSVDVEAAV